MKTKLLVVAAALLGAASLSAHAGVFFSFSFHAPFPPVPVVRVTAAAPAPVVCAAPVVYTPPIVVATPPCPTPGYVWVPGYWSGYGPGRVWVTGCWRAPVHYVSARPYYGHPYGWRR